MTTKRSDSVEPEETDELAGGAGSSGGVLDYSSGSIDDDARSLRDGVARSPRGDVQVEPVDVVRFNVPPYTGKLRPWFTRLEAQFRAARLKSQSVKFNVVLAQAPEQFVEQVSEEEIALMEDERDCYDRLKALFLRRFTPSEDERLVNLFKDMHVPSTDRPSEMYRKLLVEAKGILPADAVRKMWLMKLPAVIQMLLAQDELPVDKLLERADVYFGKYHAGKELSCDASGVVGLGTNPFLSSPVPTLSAPPPAPVAPPAETPDWASLTNAIAQLTKEVCALKRAPRGRSLQRGSTTNFRNRSATPGTSARPADQPICWYHRRWGARANDCRAPCSFTTDSGN